MRQWAVVFASLSNHTDARQMMYIRFIAGSEKEKLNVLHGPITELRMLLDEESLYEYDPCPPFSTSKWPNTAISWFKVNAEANVFIQKMYDIKAILNEHGVLVRIIKTDDPGMRLYEDDYQIVATAPRGKF